MSDRMKKGIRKAAFIFLDLHTIILWDVRPVDEG